MLAKLYNTGRSAERHLLRADATIRGTDQIPLDVFVADLSRTGCLLLCSEPLVVTTIITIGIAGITRRQARVMRAVSQQYGCEFIDALTPAELAEALLTPTETILNFSISQLAALTGADNAPEPTKLPGPVRLIILVGAAFVSWTVVIFSLVCLL